VRLLHSGIGFNLALLGLSATVNPAAIAATPTADSTANTPSLSWVATQKSDRTTIKGNGIEITLPAGFQGGSPSSAETKAIISAASKKFPSMASFMKVLESDPDTLRAIATNTSSGNPSVVLVSRLPLPAGTTLEQIQAAMKQSIASMLPPEFKVIDNRIITIGGRKVVKISIDADIDGVTIKEAVGLFRDGKNVFQVTYVYPSGNAKQAIAGFNNAIVSFKSTK
jgi:hypothetical protein